MSKIRVETGGLVGHKTKILFFENDDAEPVDISSVITAVNTSIRVGEVNRATLDVLKVEFRGDAQLVDAVVKTVPNRWWKLRRQIREVTSLADRARRWVQA